MERTPTHDPALDTKAQAVLYLSRGWSTDRTGKAVGVDGSTVRRWRQDPTFQTEVSEARRRLLDEAVSALETAVRDAIDTLHEALSDESTAVRVRAANVLLGALPGLVQHTDLGERIAALEAALQAQNGAPS